MKEQKKVKRTLEELDVIDDFLFTELLLHENVGKLLVRMIIERATGMKVNHLIIEPQKVINGMNTDKHGIRMDVRVISRNVEINNGEKELVRVFDIEPNNVKEKNIAKRDRFYQALNDVKLLNAGEDYGTMPELWTIWILPYDPFGKNSMIYSVKNTVEGFPEIEYNDGVTKIYLYTDGVLKGSEELKNLLNYLKHSKEQNATDEELVNLHRGIQSVKQEKDIGVKYMMMIDVMNHERSVARKEGREEGREEGCTFGKSQFLLKLLQGKGEVQEELQKCITEQPEEVLEQWFEIAMKCESVEEFVQQIEM